ncbi:enoyl-ACP reductase FabI [Propionibacterium australiense]|uniref:Enoyl-[acyl-carrier-protein] reductase [NADH] n=1 Tax=Propionibacterium australiense TaxID=119981 RepID=A0A383S4Y6_9ACTN|nr:enoyl-ACP reductase FabI [Propionibacterium australiense]RLP11107.1 enoyl-[acyl-carrier-protein] reductase FabI [Propionibacterium australiense]RLP12434.1 enoyl-[acyl-carrier-protein] reductase FabI [Propionibacterium australiense]SYZ32751.1 enoyl-[acyl-carrier-protein] reductase (NADH) [Propionibacterium australiense]VEH91416.1 Enoyl-[acyl-carrier-protein] reductase [NADH] [Propionibacterium australiense]
MGILEGKKILVTGITMDTSIAYKAAEVAQREGADIIVTGFGRALSLCRRVCAKLDPAPPVIELDATSAESLAALPGALAENGFDHVDGVLHSIAFANPKTALGGNFLSTDWDDVATALHTSTYSYPALAVALKDMMGPGSSVVGLTFDATISWPSYDWMGVAKAGLESANRYLARYLGPDGIRANLVSAGPIDSLAKKAIPGSASLNDVWDERAPLGWDAKDATPVGTVICALFSDLFAATTGEVIHVDGGLFSTGA